SSYYQSAWTDESTKVELLDSDAGVKFSLPELREKVVFNILTSSVESETTGGEEIQAENGETITTSAGTKITISVGEDNYDVVCGDVAAGDCVADPETYMAPMDVGTLVYLDSEAPSGAKVVVGGPVVNTVAQSVTGLADRLTQAGEVILEVDGETGNVLVMGYTAADTVKAARDLIAMIEDM
ncbi:MAG: hypothetical protein ABIA76_05065, partial [Candidatus Diapherotrites archaeon]